MTENRLQRLIALHILPHLRPAYAPWLLALVVFGNTLVVYARTAAPSVMAGDSAEFQFAAPLLAVPHPSGYPLYVLLGKLATLLPLGDVAHRVTLISCLAAACTAMLLALLVLRATGQVLAALTAATALGVTPGLWNAATIAEVYALNTLLLALLAWSLARAWDLRFTIYDLRFTMVDGRWSMDCRYFGDRPLSIVHRHWLYGAALITGLGVSHHGSFAFIGAPLFVGYGLLPLWAEGRRQKAEGRRQRLSICLLPAAFCLLWGLLGLTPWLFVLVQYARLGPFDGHDHGLPRAYFWGAPGSWGAALSHLAGGTMRANVFRLPDSGGLAAALLALWERLWFEWGPLGLALGAVGCWQLLRRMWWVWLGSAWVALITTLYFAALSSAVQDAMVFTLPLLLPWALWVGAGAAYVADLAALLFGRAIRHDQRSSPMFTIGRWSCVILLFSLTLAWGRTRLPHANKADQWLFRNFGAGALARMEPGAAVLVRWEQGTILQYLRLVEGSRLDVQVDIVEPENDPWLARARRRFPNRPVYFIGSPADGASLGAQYVWGTDYASLFRLPDNAP